MALNINNITQSEVDYALTRAAHTFYQAFLAVFAAGLANVLDAFGKRGISGAKSAGLALITAAIAAGISAVVHLVSAAKA